MTKKKVKYSNVQPCVGYWTACVTCDGGKNPETKLIEEACKWRRRCKLIRDYLINHDIDPQKHKKRWGDDVLLRILEKLEAGKSRMKPKKQRIKRKGSRTKKRMLSCRYNKLEKKFERFMEIVAEEFVKQDVVEWRRRKTAAVLPGHVYVIPMKTKKIAYLVKMRARKGHAFKVINIWFAPINGGFDIQFRNEEPFSDLPEDLTWRKWKNVPMFGAIKTLKTEEHYRYVAQKMVEVSSNEHQRTK